MQKTKLISEQDQARRGVAFAKLFGVVGFAMFMTFPLLNMIVGMFVFIALAMKIFSASAQRAKDMLWLVIGSVVCLLGFFLPALLDGPTSKGIATGFFLDFLLNLLVAIFVAGGKLGHLLRSPGQS